MTTPSATGRPATALTPKVRSALTRYRVMAYVAGTLFIVLTVAVIVKYTVGGTTANVVTSVAGFAHGWLFIVYLLTVFDLAVKARLSWGRVFGVALCGVLPVLTFVAERKTVHAVLEGRS